MKEIRQGNTFVEDCGLHEETDDRELCGCRLQMALTVSGADSTGRAGTLGSLGLGTAAAAFYAKRRSKILKIHTDISPLWQKLTKNLRAGFKVTHTKKGRETWNDWKAQKMVHLCWIDRSICSAPAMAWLTSGACAMVVLCFNDCEAMQCNGWMDRTNVGK